MDSRNDNGKKSVSVTVATDTEPVTVDGFYSDTADGFALQFQIGEDSFTVEHGEKQTTVKAKGMMSYDITLCEENTSTMLSTPFGMVKFDVKTELRRAEEKDGELRLMLFYVLHADGVGDMPRSVDLTIRNSEL